MMRIIRAKDYEDMSRKAAAVLAAQVTVKPDCVLGLATGSTPIGTYDCLAQWCKEGVLDFSRVSTVNLDEYRGLDHENDQSYYYFMNKPVVYFAYDLDEYGVGRGLYYDFEEYVYGNVASNRNELVKCIKNENLCADKRKEFGNRFLEACDGYSTIKTAAYITESMSDVFLSYSLPEGTMLM